MKLWKNIYEKLEFISNGGRVSLKVNHQMTSSHQYEATKDTSSY